MAMDAFSVATVTGFALKKLDYNLAVKMSVVFGSFHVFIPYLGWTRAHRWANTYRHARAYM